MDEMENIFSGVHRFGSFSRRYKGSIVSFSSTALPGSFGKTEYIVLSV